MLGCWAITEHKTIKGGNAKGSTDTINSPISSHPGFSVKASDCLQQILCRAAKLLGAAQGSRSADSVPSGWNFASARDHCQPACLEAGGTESEPEFLCGCHSVPTSERVIILTVWFCDPVLPSLQPAFGQHLCTRISLRRSSSFPFLYPPAGRSLRLEVGSVYEHWSFQETVRIHHRGDDL